MRLTLAFRGQIGSQPWLVELPVAVLPAVEEHHRKPVAVLGPHGWITRRCRRIDVGGGQLEAQLVGQFAEPAGGALAQ